MEIWVSRHHLYNEDNCPPIQKLCDAQPPGNNPELIDSNWKEVTFGPGH